MSDRNAVAIIGISCTFPKARRVADFWQNIVNKVDAVTDVTPDRWDPEIFFDPDPNAEDKLYCKKGGWIGGTFAFNPAKYGIMPRAIEGAEPDHFLVLRAVYEAMEDAGYLHRELDGQRVSVILGKGNYLGPGVTNLMYRGIVTEQTLAIIRGLIPELTDQELDRVKREIRERLPKISADVAAGLIPNISTGRVANRLDFMGRNFTVDGACASSLLATELSMHSLLSGKDDLVLAGGVHIFAHVPFLQVFDAMRAVSLTSHIQPYDAHCDGTIAGEGIGVLVLKRLADAERDGDRIYALIRGVGSSSDGKAKSVTAPRAEGEELAIRRAYESSGVAPETVELIEGHGTGTPVGDETELIALNLVFGTSVEERPGVALGSVKSMIGHTMPAAGSAGLIKTALALYHRVLPPTLNCTSPHPLLEGSRLYVNATTRPWIHSDKAEPRRAGVNAFGFGGINSHLVLEEYTGDIEAQRPTLLREWSSETVVLEAETRQSLIEKIEALRDYAAQAQGVTLRDVAYTLNTKLSGSQYRIAVVASSLHDLASKLDKLAGRLREPTCCQVKDREGLFYLSESEVRGGKVALLFPGEGSQYLGMLSDLCIHFPEVRQIFDSADAAVCEPGRLPASSIIFPPAAFSPEDKSAEERLFSIERATEAVLTADGAIVRLLERLGLKADMMAGHSAGEWVGLAASGILEFDEFVSSLNRLSQIYRDLEADQSIPRASMLAVGAGRAEVEQLVAQIDRRIFIANDNCPHQIVVVCAPDDAPAIINHLQLRGVFVEKLPYDRGYHTPVFTYIREPLRRYVSSLQIRSPKLPLYSCTTAQLFPSDPKAILDLVTNTFAEPLLFRQMIEQMHEDGARIFLEAGPRGNLTAFVDDVLRGHPRLAIAIDQYHTPGLNALQHAIAMLSAAHVPLNLAPLYERRSARLLKFDLDSDPLIEDDHAPGVIQVSTHYPRLGVPAPIPRPQAASTNGTRRPVVHVPSNGVASGPFPAQAGLNHTDAGSSIAGSDGQNGVPEKFSETANVLTTQPTTGAGHIQLAAPRILQDHFTLMEELLSTHEDIMLSFLRGAPGTVLGARAGANPTQLTAHAASASAVALAPVCRDQPERLNDQIQTPAAPIALKSPKPQPMSPAIQPVAPSIQPVTGSGQLQNILLDIVSERTGYPKDMLGLDLDLEADLGIDSIKRIEILSALRDLSGRGSGEEVVEAISGLKTLRQVIAYLEGTSPQSAEVNLARPTPHLPALGPMLRSGSIITLVPGESVEVRCTIDPRKHLFLNDHSLYFAASDWNEQAEPVLSFPMTCSLELMAEVATLLCPNLRVVGANNIQALRWINVEDRNLLPIMDIMAQKLDANRVKVSIRTQTGEGEKRPAANMAESIIVFGSDFLPQPRDEKPPLMNPKPPRCPEDGLYSDHRMFHGPSFQGVISLKAVAENGVRGELQVLPTTRVLASDPSPRFCFDPFLLDAAGQMVGYWPVEYLEEGFVVLPIRINQVTLYRENLKPGDRVRSESRIRDVSQRQFCADFDVFAPDGTLWMRVMGWEDWRFYWTRNIYEFWRFPNRGFNGVGVAMPQHDAFREIECRRVDSLSEVEKSGLWENLWMHMVLNRRELQEFQEISDNRLRSAWIFEKAAAKDAVRAWVKRKSGCDLYPADIDLSKVEDRRIQVNGKSFCDLPKPEIAVAYCGSAAFACAHSEPIGIAVESLDATEGEMSSSEQDSRLECAKTATTRIVGISPGPVSVANIDEFRSTVRMMINETPVDVLVFKNQAYRVAIACRHKI